MLAVPKIGYDLRPRASNQSLELNRHVAVALVSRTATREFQQEFRFRLRSA